MSSDTIGLPPAHARREADVAARSTDDAYSHTTAHSPAVPNSCGGCRGAGREEGWGRSHSTLHVATTCTYTRNISLSLLLPECDTARTTGAGECRGARLPPRLDSTRARPHTPAHARTRPHTAQASCAPSTSLAPSPSRLGRDLTSSPTLPSVSHRRPTRAAACAFLSDSDSRRHSRLFLPAAIISVPSSRRDLKRTSDSTRATRAATVGHILVYSTLCSPSSSPISARTTRDADLLPSIRPLSAPVSSSMGTAVLCLERPQAAAPSE